MLAVRDYKVELLLMALQEFGLMHLMALSKLALMEAQEFLWFRNSGWIFR